MFHLSDAGFLLGRRLVQSHIQLHRSQTFNLSLKHHVDRESVLHGQCKCLMLLISAVICVAIVENIRVIVYRLYFHPLAHIPGPLLARASFY